MKLTSRKYYLTPTTNKHILVVLILKRDIPKITKIRKRHCIFYFKMTTAAGTTATVTLCYD
jgi:hypothetical protein